MSDYMDRIELIQSEQSSTLSRQLQSS